MVDLGLGLLYVPYFFKIFGLLEVTANKLKRVATRNSHNMYIV